MAKKTKHGGKGCKRELQLQTVEHDNDASECDDDVVRTQILNGADALMYAFGFRRVQ
jgi:hypothetical protein